MGFGRRKVSWLPGLPAAPSRTTRFGGGPVALTDGIPDHSGGSAPDSHRLPSATDLRTRGFYSDETRLVHTTVNTARDPAPMVVAPIDGTDGTETTQIPTLPAARALARFPASAAVALCSLALATPASGSAAEPPPTVTTGTAGETGLTSAVLSGTVGSGAPLKGCWFEWGVPARFEARASCEHWQRATAGSGTAPAPVSAHASGMLSGTTYQWRVALVHNYLLGGYGNDTIWAGARGDVIWGDYHPEGQRKSQYDALHGGSGTDWIYSSHGYNQIWTGAGDDHLALVYGWGVVHCNGPGLKTLVMRYLPRNRRWRLIGCRRKKIVPYKA